MKWKRWVVILLAVVLLAGGGWWLWGRQQNPLEGIRTASVRRQDVKQEVTFTGRLEPVNKVDLGFALSGTVKEVFVKEGQSIEAGQVLARIDTTSSQLEVAKAAADKYSAQEEMYVRWQNAEEEYAATRAENARSLEKKRQAVRDAKAELDQKRAIRQQVNGEEGDDSSVTGTAYANVLAAETAYHAAQQALEEALKTAKKVETTAKNAAEVAQSQYESTQQASGAVAGLSSLQALEHLARVSVEKGVLTAPFSGIVTRRDLGVGEIAQIGTPAFTIETTDALEVVAEVTETDATKLLDGMRVTFTFDALPQHETLEGSVISVAPSAEIVEGVPTYEVRLLIPYTDQLRPGLTVNVTVHAQEVHNVLSVPRRSVLQGDGRQYVRILTADGAIREQAVRTGLVGSDGQIEITEGVAEGEEIVIAVPDESP